MEAQAVALTALVLLFYAAASKWLQTGVITAPMVFAALGLIMGPGVLNLLSLPSEAEFFRLLSEFTLVLVLFSDASRIDLRLARRGFTLPLRLLGLGLPLCIAAGTAAALLLFPEFSTWEALTVAAILAPTDAALGQAVVADKRVPVRIRQGLNVESGLNDGLALPVVLFALCLADGTQEAQGGAAWLAQAARQITLGPLAGAAVGFLGGHLLVAGAKRGWTDRIFQDLATLGLALLSWAVAHLIGGNEFMAAFVGGLTVGNLHRPLGQSVWEFAEAEGQLLVLMTFLVFGTAMVWPALGLAGWQVWLYAGLSLTVVRLLPVMVSLAGMKLRPVSVVFVGWFGPRGLASVLYALLMLHRFQVGNSELILTLVGTTVLLSIFAHGLSASPSAAAYGTAMERLRHGVAPGAPAPPELIEVAEIPLRLPYEPHGARRSVPADDGKGGP